MTRLLYALLRGVVGTVIIDINIKNVNIVSFLQKRPTLVRAIESLSVVGSVNLILAQSACVEPFEFFE